MELALFVAEYVTGNRDFDTYNVVVSTEDSSISKLAIFSGSPAAGFPSPRGFAEIHNYEMNPRYPNSEFYIKNLATSGSLWPKRIIAVTKGLNTYRTPDQFQTLPGDNFDQR